MPNSMDSAESSKTRRILAVDDEPNILSALRRGLATPPLGRYRYELETFTSPIDALERGMFQEFEVVLSDFRMPQMNGLEFLKLFAGVQPDCVSIVLSGQTELGDLIRMINETHIYRYIPKPWSNYFLKSSVSQAIDFRRTHVKNRHLAELLQANGIAVPRQAANPLERILLVDGDYQLLENLSRSFQHSQFNNIFSEVSGSAEGLDGIHTLPDPIQLEVQISASGHNALRLADVAKFSCVIADFRLPDMSGVQFLTDFVEKQPDCDCILISDEADMDGLVNALYLAHIHAFIAKPVVAHELHSATAQVLARRRLQLQNQALAQVCRARGLLIAD